LENIRDGYKTATPYALQDLYKVDLRSVVDFDPEAANMGASGKGVNYGEPDEYVSTPGGGEQW
jgi:hypothetical protein